MDQRMSQGTAETTVEASGKRGKIRRHGRIVDLPIGKECRNIDFGRGQKRAMPIPWGDVVSDYDTAGIPNDTVFVYTPVSAPLLAIARLMNVFAPILQSPRVQNWLVQRIEKGVKGQSVERCRGPFPTLGQRRVFFCPTRASSCRRALRATTSGTR
jgi:short subunit dehydrogenase-like uncharacterized protein